MELNHRKGHMVLSYWLAGAASITSVVLPEQPITSQDVQLWSISTGIFLGKEANQ